MPKTLFACLKLNIRFAVDQNTSPESTTSASTQIVSTKLGHLAETFREYMAYNNNGTKSRRANNNSVETKKANFRYTDRKKRPMIGNTNAPAIYTYGRYEAG